MNKYEIVGVVGEGAYGVVLKCKNKENGEIQYYSYILLSSDKKIQRVGGGWGCQENHIEGGEDFTNAQTGQRGSIEGSI